MKKTTNPGLAAVAALLALSAPTSVRAQESASDDAAVEAAVRTITAGDFAWRVGVIAHDSMAGRNTPSIGLDRTAEWIASEFRRLGLRGGAEGGGFIQRYPLQAVTVEASVTLGGERLAPGVDVLPVRGTLGSGEVSGGVLLVSGSMGAPQAITRASVAGRHAVLFRPAAASRRDRVTAQLANALRAAGAASVLLAQGGPDDDWIDRRARASQAAVSKGWGDDGASATGPLRPMLDVRIAALERALEGRGLDLRGLEARASGPVRLDAVEGVELTVAQRSRVERISAPNVVGILDGSDPELRDEHVVFSGHMDHVGIGAPDANGDSIFNGADDDASGTVAVMEVAEAMASLPAPPRRSMVFLLVSGEEKGLWGSEWFAENPSVPIEQLVADLNTDMVGRNWADTIVAIGKEHSDLGETLNRVNAGHPELRMTAIDDLWPEERFYFRSDHYNFARRGVPVLFFFNGTHDDYHGRDDEPDRIDSEKAARIARLVFYLGLEIGNAEARPKWNPESYARIVSDR